MIAQYIREKGIAKGVMQGQTKLFARLLEVRFGGIPKWAMQKIEFGDMAAIEEWGIRLLAAEKIEDVFNA